MGQVDADLLTRLRKTERRRQRAAWLPVAPAVLFLAAVFLIPIAAIFYFAVESTDVRQAMPRTTRALADWGGDALPGAATYTAVVDDLREAFPLRTIYPAARELNNRLPGFRSVIVNAGRRAQQWPAGAGRAQLFEQDDTAWSDLEHWRTIKAATAPLTAYRLLAAVDLRPQWKALPSMVPEEQRIYLRYLGRTFWICGVVTLACLVLGYPLAYLTASARGPVARILLTLTLLPFWTSILVRTAAWVIVLQQQGVVNSILEGAGIIEQPLTMIYNRFGVYVVMTHVLLPFMVLPIYSVMKGIPKNLLPAAASLGAKPVAAFLQVYLPQSSAGVAAGCLLTFVLGLGYYVTPALVGGATDQMESGLIAHFALDEGNRGMAASLAAVLLIVMLFVYATYARVAKSRVLKLR